MKKILTAAVLLIIVTIGAIAIWKHRQVSPAAQSGTPATIGEPAAGDPVAAEAWSVFERYRQAAAAHDLTTVKTLVYKLSDTCLTAPTGTECLSRMDEAASTTKQFKQSDFTRVAYDNKQIVLFTDWHTETTDIAQAYAREVIYFARSADGAPKVLYFTQPEELVWSLRNKGEDPSSYLKDLAPRTIDSDGDFAADEVETCSYPGADKACVKTDPHKKDSLGDGWWDGVRPYVPKP